ncbi:MAG: histidine kinase dimerization/phospho-acceptor domain-containing protein, partial [Bryobacteraceae bacterium]
MPIRTRLTLSFTCLFGVIVFSLAIGSYMLVRNSLLSDLKTQLEVAVDGTAMAAQHELLEHPSAAPGEADLQEILNGMREAALPDTQILVRQGSRQVAYKAGSNASTDLRTLSSDRLREGYVNNLRIAFHQLPVNKFNLTYELYAAASTDLIFNRLRRFALMLFVLIPLGLLLAAAAGFGLAKKALAPLNELSKTIEAVTSSDLSLRIKASGDGDEISAIGKRFNGLLDRLQGAFDAERSFMADASHEIRTPVTVALAAAQVTNRDPSRTRQDSDEALRIVEQQMLRLKNIVQQLLFLSQADSSALNVNLKYVYLDDVVKDAVAAARLLTKEKRVSIELEAPPEAQIRGDSELLGQAVMVLLDNAVKFTPSGGRIGVGI